jgi:hypothetical protein
LTGAATIHPLLGNTARQISVGMKTIPGGIHGRSEKEEAK